MGERVQKLAFREDLQPVGFEIMTLGELYERTDSALLATDKFVRFHEIIFVAGGRGEHRIDFETHHVERGDIVFIGKNQVCAWEKRRRIDGFVILFTEAFLFKNQVQFDELSYDYPYNSVLYNPVLKISGKSHYETFLSLVELVYREYAQDGCSLKHEVLQTLLRALILKARSQLPPSHQVAPSDSKALFVLFQKKLDEHISHTRNANDYTNLTGSSYYQLNSAVKEFSGKSIKSFIDSTVILKAKQLLCNQDLNVSEVAHSLGFDEATNFSKFFRKLTDTSPKTFRERLSQYG